MTPFVFLSLKYLWTPYVCTLAAFGVCSPELWMTLFKWLRLRTVHPVLLVSHCYFVLNTWFSYSYINANHIDNNCNSMSRKKRFYEKHFFIISDYKSNVHQCTQIKKEKEKWNNVRLSRINFCNSFLGLT